MTEAAAARPDNNSLGKGAFIIGLIGLVLAFVPLIGFVSWLLGPLAILCGAIALRRPPRALAIAGLITGGLTLLVCVWWINAAKAIGEAVNKDTFNTTGQVADLSNAPIVDTSVKGLWKEMEDNKVAAGTKYGGKRLRFVDEKIEDFEGDAADPRLQFIGATEEYLVHLVSASFTAGDGAKIAALKKGGKVTFVCDAIKESFGDGYGLGGCTLQ
jgi:hypothetical protein